MSNKELWADIIRNTNQQGLAKKSFGPYYVDPIKQKLSLIQESQEVLEANNRKLKKFPIYESTGWVQLNDKYIIWCALGADDILFNRRFPRTARGQQAGKFNLSFDDILYLIGTGQAFLYCEELYFMPSQKFEMNSFNFELEGHEKLSVFVGYRGHSLNYPEIVSPSLLREFKKPTKEKYLFYKRNETYCSNIVKQVFWEHQNIALNDIQARGILQHHKILDDTDILDLSYDINVAKWFSLNNWNSKLCRYEKKDFKYKEFDAAYGEASLIYEVFVRVIGGTDQPLSIKYNNQEIRLHPWNVSPLWSERPFRQRGFGIDGIRRKDTDKFGAVLNIVEHKYHPVIFPNGWDNIGGTNIELFNENYSIEADMSHLAGEILPQEDNWFQDMEETIKSKLKKSQNIY